MFVGDERDAAAHSRREVAPGVAEYDDGAAGHVFAAVIADAFDDRGRTAVAHCEALARRAGDERFARCRAVEHRVADDRQFRRREAAPSFGGRIDDPPAGQSLADVVVGFALELERQIRAPQTRRSSGRPIR